MRYLVYVGIFCLLFVFSVSGLSVAKTPEKVDSDALQSKISREKGKVVLVNFWTTACPHCREEIQELKKLREKFAENQLAIFGVAMERNKEKIRDFAQSRDINYSLYQGGRDVISTFGLQGVPTTYIYGLQGEVQKNRVGFMSLEQLESIVNNLLE